MKGMPSEGTELVLDGATTPDEWWMLVQEVRQRWPQALFRQNAVGDLAFYRDQDALRASMSGGHLQSGIIQVQIGPEHLRIVVDGKDASTLQVGKDVLEVLQALREE